MQKKSTIGGRIRWIIEKHMNISQADFSRKMKKSRQLVNRWLNDSEHPPEEKSLQEIADISGVSLAWLRYGGGDPFQEDARPGLDPVVLETALNDIFRIAGIALGMNIQIPSRNRIDADLIDVSPDIMAVLSHEEEFLRVGRQWSDALSWSREDIEGKRWEDMAHPGDVKTARLAFSISRDQNAIVEFDGRAKEKDGQYKNIRWRITSEPDRLYLAGRETVENEPRSGMQVIARGDKDTP